MFLWKSLKMPKTTTMEPANQLNKLIWEVENHDGNSCVIVISKSEGIKKFIQHDTCRGTRTIENSPGAVSSKRTGRVPTLANLLKPISNLKN